MTREKSIRQFEVCEDAKQKLIKDCQPPTDDWEQYADRLHDIAYKSGYEQAKKDILNNMRAEIEQALRDDYAMQEHTVDKCLRIISKYVNAE